MIFQPLTLKDRSIIRHYLSQSDFPACDYSFANLFMWSGISRDRFSISHDMLVFRSLGNGNSGPVYMYPAGNGDLEQVIYEMTKDAHSLNSLLTIRGFTGAEAAILEKLFPGRFEITSPREQWDYLYSTKDLISLSGSRYHGKRNHIAQFKKAYPDYSYREITSDNIHLCYDFVKIWYDYQLSNGNSAALTDRSVVMNALDYFSDLELTGGILSADGRVAAFTIGEPLNSNSYVVHIEKALPFIRGAYPMINQLYAAEHMENFTYINREEDDGIPGLIRAKESYHPVKMVQKCVAVEKKEI